MDIRQDASTNGVQYGSSGVNFINPQYIYPASSLPQGSSSISGNKIPGDSTPASSYIYLLKDLPAPASVTGSTNLLSHFGLEATYNKFSSGKKVKENLSSFLPDLPGYINTVGMEDGSSLRAIIEKPPIVGGKEIQPLSPSLLASFRLHPGPLLEQYRALHQPVDSRRKSKHRNKHKLDIPLDGEEFEHRKYKKKKHEDSERKKKKKEKKKKREREKERS